MCAESDGHGDRSRADGDWQCVGIEGVSEDGVRVNLVGGGRGPAGAIEERPSGYRDDEAAANLDCVNRDAEEGEDFDSGEHGDEEDEEAVDSDLLREEAVDPSIKWAHHVEEDGGATEGIDDGKERGDDEEGRFDYVRDVRPKHLLAPLPSLAWDRRSLAC